MVWSLVGDSLDRHSQRNCDYNAGFVSAPPAPKICGVGQKACKGGIWQLGFFSVEMKRERSILVRQTPALLMVSK